jgi:hypothetical protein
MKCNYEGFGRKRFSLSTSRNLQTFHAFKYIFFFYALKVNLS